MKDLKVVFMGTPVFAVPILNSLIENCNVIGVVTKPDSNNSYPPIKNVAISNNIPVFQPKNIKVEYQDILNLNPDVIITCAYGQFIPAAILDYPKYKCINVHASILPKLRGGAPIHRAIINGYKKTGITIMYMDLTMDTGDILSVSETEISDLDTVGTLHDRLSLMGATLLIDTLKSLLKGDITPIKQDNSLATFAPNIKREDERIDFSKTKEELFNLIRGLNPFPGAYSTLDGKIVKIYSSRISYDYNFSSYGEVTNIYKDGIGVSTKNGEIIITEIQIEGKKRMTVLEYLNGIQNKESFKGKVFL